MVDRIFFCFMTLVIVFKDLTVWGFKSIPTPPIGELCDFSQAEADTNAQPFIGFTGYI